MWPPAYTVWICFKICTWPSPCSQLSSYVCTMQRTSEHDRHEIQNQTLQYRKCALKYDASLCPTLLPFQSQTGATPLFIAAQNGHTKTGELLINGGGDVNLQRNVSMNSHSSSQLFCRCMWLNSWCVCLGFKLLTFCIVSLHGCILSELDCVNINVDL